MSEAVRDLAIVLKSVLFEERHRIVTALTQENGLVSALAKNSVQSRRFGGTLDLFVVSEWQFTQRPGSEVCLLSEAQFKEGFTGLRSDFIRMSLASTLSELMMRFAPKQENCINFFRLHSNALTVLNTLDVNDSNGLGFKLLNAYLVKLLQSGGNQPRSECLECHRSLTSLVDEVDAEIGLGSSSDSNLDLNQLEDLRSVRQASLELVGVVGDGGWVCGQCRATSMRSIQSGQSGSGRLSQVRVSLAAALDLLVFLVSSIREAPFLAKASLDEHRALFEFLEGLLVYHVPGFDQMPMKSLKFLGLRSSLTL